MPESNDTQSNDTNLEPQVEELSPSAWWLEIGLVFLVFLLYGGWHVPDLNEPYYMAKAKHYWNPDWCAGDLFLDTADSHTVFYWTFGALTMFLPLPVATLIGRLIVYLALAWGWQRLSYTLVPKKIFAVLSALVFVVLTGNMHMAGEWVVAGLEGKCMAYAICFVALAELVRGRWNRVWLLLGVASAFHVLVGGWSVVAAGIAWLRVARDENSPSLLSMLPALAGGLLIAMLGLLPGLALDQGVDPQVAAEAFKIQVFDRLPHHLDAGQFFFGDGKAKFLITNFGFRFLALIAVWVAIWRFGPRDDSHRRIHSFVLGSIIIATVGLLITIVTVYGLQDVTFAAKLLRFYWFRLSDTMVPLGVALGWFALLAQWGRNRPAICYSLVSITAILAGGFLLDTVQQRHPSSLGRADLKLARRGSAKEPSKVELRHQDWLDLCEYASEHSPLDARFLTPRHSHTFKWYSNRGEVAVWKEMPQDAQGVVDWWERVNWWKRMNESNPIEIHSWVYAHRTPAELRQLGREYGATYVVTITQPQVDLPEFYRNDSFVIYSLAEEKR